MFEVQILCPLADNDGRTFTQADFAAFEAVVIERFGGVTRYPTVEGAWSDGIRLYRDRSTVYGVAVRTITDGAKLAEVVTFAKVHFRQEAIFLRYLGVAEIL